MAAPPDRTPNNPANCPHPSSNPNGWDRAEGAAERIREQDALIHDGPTEAEDDRVMRFKSRKHQAYSGSPARRNPSAKCSRSACRLNGERSIALRIVNPGSSLRRSDRIFTASS